MVLQTANRRHEGDSVCYAAIQSHLNLHHALSDFLFNLPQHRVHQTQLRTCYLSCLLLLHYESLTPVWNRWAQMNKCKGTGILDVGRWWEIRNSVGLRFILSFHFARSHKWTVSDVKLLSREKHGVTVRLIPPSTEEFLIFLPKLTLSLFVHHRVSTTVNRESK